MMNKNALRNGDMVVMNNGKKATYMVVNGTPIFRYHTKAGSFSYVNKYSDSLVHPSNHDYSVREVYRVRTDVAEKVRGDAIFNPDKMYEYGENISNRCFYGNDASSNTDATDFGAKIYDIQGTKTGDLIVFANGKTGTVFRDMPNCPDIVRFHTDKNSFMPLTRWDGLDHKTKAEYNIEKIYRASTEGDASKLYDVIGHPDRMMESGILFFDVNADLNEDDYSAVADNLAIGYHMFNVDLEDTGTETSDTVTELLKILGANTKIISELIAKL